MRRLGEVVTRLVIRWRSVVLLGAPTGLADGLAQRNRATRRQCLDSPLDRPGGGRWVPRSPVMETRRAGGTVPGRPATRVIPIRPGLPGNDGQAAEEQGDDGYGERR